MLRLIYERGRMTFILMGIQFILTIVMIVLLICVLAKIDNIPTEPITVITESSSASVEPSVPEQSEPTPEAPEALETPETTTVINPTELEMLACVIYQEAGGDGTCDECRRRVADVVLNRVADSRFPNTIYDVLTSKNQYGRFYYTGIVWPERASNAGEQHAVERAYRIAQEVLSGQHSDLYGKGYIWQATFVQGTDNIYHCRHYFGR